MLRHTDYSSNFNRSWSGVYKGRKKQASLLRFDLVFSLSEPTFFLWWQSFVEVLLITGTFQSLMILVPDSVIGLVIIEHMHSEVCSAGVLSMHTITCKPIFDVTYGSQGHVYLTCLITCWLDVHPVYFKNNALFFSLTFIFYHFHEIFFFWKNKLSWSFIFPMTFFLQVCSFLS